MNDQEKMEAISGNAQVSVNLLAINLYRLMYGDLSHIGDAISKGSTILNKGHTFGADFSEPSKCYTIKPKTIMFNGCEINAPIAWEDFDPQGDFVRCATPTGITVLNRQEATGYIKAGVAFNNCEDAEAYRKAAGWVK